MVQTRRRAALRGAALMRLPTDVLHKIATHTVSPGLVVAAGKNVDVRTALRKGTDAAERSRFGGIGLTTKEAEQVLRTRYQLPDIDLASREAVTQAFCRRNSMVSENEDHPDAPEDYRGMTGNGFITSRLIKTLLAYGADASVRGSGYTPLHFLAAHIPSDAIELAQILLAAGADIDAECDPDDGAGTCALTWCTTTDEFPLPEAQHAFATFLIEQGCDVVKADAGFRHANDSYVQTFLDSLEEYLVEHPSTPAFERLMILVTDSIEEAGPERRQAKNDAARQRAEDAHGGKLREFYGLGDSDSPDY